MFDHVTIRVSDRDASRRFYETVLSPLGHSASHSDDGPEWNVAVPADDVRRELDALIAG